LVPALQARLVTLLFQLIFRAVLNTWLLLAVEAQQAVVGALAVF
jgi:hypothetical protein